MRRLTEAREASSLLLRILDLCDVDLEESDDVDEEVGVLFERVMSGQPRFFLRRLARAPNERSQLTIAGKLSTTAYASSLFSTLNALEYALNVNSGSGSASSQRRKQLAMLATPTCSCVRVLVEVVDVVEVESVRGSGGVMKG